MNRKIKFAGSFYKICEWLITVGGIGKDSQKGIRDYLLVVIAKDTVELSTNINPFFYKSNIYKKNIL
jgi:hypothetical protein